MSGSRAELTALQDEALRLNGGSGKNRNVNEHIITSSYINEDHLVLKLLVAHLRAGNYELYCVYELCKKLQARYMDNIEKLVTVPATKIYSDLSDFLRQHANRNTSFQRNHLLMTASLSGETDHALVCALVRERFPKDGDEFLAMMKEARNVPSSVSSGVL